MQPGLKCAASVLQDLCNDHRECAATQDAKFGSIKGLAMIQGMHLE